MQYTENQEQVIAHRDGALIVLAGAGSGKTSTICARAARLIQAGLEPEQHLMLTFSRKAALEMRMRCVKLLRSINQSVPAYKLPVDTYHAFGYRLLWESPSLAHRREGLTLQDDADRKRTLRSICAAMDLDYKAKPSRFEGWYRSYSLAKNYGLCAADETDHEPLLTLFLTSRASETDKPETILRFAVEYERRLRMTNTLDFDDLCLWAARGLRDNPELGAQYAERYPMVTVDEAQDTNLVQYQMVHAIAKNHRNMTMVGDDDQSIYGWRGALVSNMRQFITDYHPQQLRLEQNFRSTPALVKAAADHIRHNRQRLDKHPFAAGADGALPSACIHDSGWDMADAIATRIQASLNNGVPPESIAVLYRTNRMARVIESGIRARGIPYTIVGGHSLYDAAEVKAAIAGVRVLTNGHDENAFWQLLPHISGLGKRGLETLIETAAEDPTGRLDLFGAAAQCGGRLLQAFIWLDERIRVLSEWGPTRVGQWVLDDQGLGYARRLREGVENGSITPEELERRTRNLEMLDRTTAQAQKLQQDQLELDGPPAQRFRLLIEAQISDPGETDEGAPLPQVVLSTAHRAKGLEWEVVHVAGYSEGLMPMTPREGASAEAHLAEERRLSYVAITRAQRECVLHHAETLLFPGDAEPSELEPSRFFDELGLAVSEPELRTGKAQVMEGF